MTTRIWTDDMKKEDAESEASELLADDLEFQYRQAAWEGLVALDSRIKPVEMN